MATNQAVGNQFGDGSEWKTIAYTDLISSGSLVTPFTSSIVLPEGARVLEVETRVAVVFNVGTSCAATIGTTSSASAFVTSKDLKTVTGALAHVAGGYDLATDADQTVTLSIASVGTIPTTGKLLWRVKYSFDESTVYAYPTVTAS